MNDDFLNSVLERILELKSFEKRTVFSISTTTKQEQNPYLTPVRACQDFVLGGCVIFDQEHLSSLLKKIDGAVDIILADSEKMIPLRVRKLNSVAINRLDRLGEVRISKICFQLIKKSHVFEYKPNDLTINAAWSFLSQRLNYLDEKKICILGAGNIGSKLALKLVECGADVGIYRRNIDKGYIIIDGLNLIKPECVNKKIQLYSDAEQASYNADVLIGASSGVPIIDENIVKNLKRDCLIVDLGKNNLTENAIKIATEYSLNIFRTDVTPAIEAFVYELLKTQDILKHSYGKKDLGFCNIVSGGYFGRTGDIVVDSIDSPIRVLGVAHGNGLLKQALNTTDKKNIERLKKSLSIE
ncbi:hypothetical protein N8899_03545 [Amylibacter sp.]|nr:hypothetical protein [Amylibacter sp.]